jgi:hypothetical protein
MIWWVEVEVERERKAKARRNWNGENQIGSQMDTQIIRNWLLVFLFNYKLVIGFFLSTLDWTL